jgi:Ulp1 family protease
MQIVDSYLFLIVDYVNKRNAKLVYSVSTFFYAYLHAQGYAAVSNWIGVSLYTRL